MKVIFAAEKTNSGDSEGSGSTAISEENKTSLIADRRACYRVSLIEYRFRNYLEI